MSRDLREKEYYRAAFMEGPHLMGLACAGAAALVFPGLWALALPLAEVFYLAGRSNTRAFRRKVESGLASERNSEISSARQKMISMLDEKSIASYRRFVEELRNIENTTHADNEIMTDSMDVAFVDQDLAQLSHMAWIYLKTLHTWQRMNELITLEEKALVANATANADITSTKRAANLIRAREEEATLARELESLEGRVALMKSNQLLLGNPELFWHEVDEAGKGLEETEQWLDQAEISMGRIPASPEIDTAAHSPINQNGRSSGNDTARAKGSDTPSKSGASPFSRIRTRIEKERKES
ncbi:MAG: hypothetical protein CVV64_15540 [Candidatus Wallbacteria bacterium HGW-Wallbacteria-1]|jgi:hypothetical protein|uniref:Uncharacterized protein n=1 Tax=Candidatus Wallbacteria bacterium HGW-Wallbacteria-1 TaxID=2013854 RepID=A0A2N1PLJ6_9BACT|nr:MAG: hypothetical protein CVV64_15540 [Candidatus Wallbacteria bacterium HGW-Wallbacteria-1]